jgi:ligand-binding sensor domain-containing protein
MKTRFFVVLAIFFHQAVFAQVGHYFLSHYSIENQGNSLSFDIAQDDKGLMYFATRTGLKQFDGRNWHAVKNSPIVYTLSVAPSGKVYVAGDGIVGVLSTASDFTLQVNTLLNEPGAEFFESALTKETIVFVSEKKLVIHDLSTAKNASLALPPNEDGFANVFELYGVGYASTFDGSIYKIQEGKLLNAEFKLNSPITFSAGLGDNYFVATEDQQLFLFSPERGLKKIPVVEEKYLSSGVIVSGVWVSPNLIAIGTLNGGVLFLDPTTGKTQETINYFSGLPDNEVFCLKRDAEGNVWVGHEYGYSCISPNLPFRSFNHYEGLKGNILCAKTFGGKVYVGTSVGLFYLEKQDQVGEEVFYVEQKGKSLKKNNALSKKEAEKETKKRGFLGFKRRSNRETTTEATKTSAGKAKIRQTRRVIVGTTYVFKKVDGISSKVARLLVSNQRLYAAGLAGLFEIEGSKSKVVVQEPVEVVSVTNQHGIVGETYQSRVFSHSKSGSHTTLLEDLHDDVSSVVEDKEGTLWIAGAKDIYQFKKGKATGNFSYANPSLDRTEGMNWNGIPLFVNTNGFYIVQNGAVRSIDSLGKPSHFFATDNNLWYRQGETWRCLGSFQKHENIEYLNIFSDLRYIEADAQNETLWIVTNNNELFKFYSNRLVPQSIVYPLLVRSVRSTEKFYQPGLPYYKFEQQDGELVIEAVQAAFGSQHGAQYRFALVGSEADQWSEWSSNNQIVFPFLPLGTYSFKLQTRDVLGKINELPAIRLKIDPPFWRTPWFYAMEFAFFSVLVIMSIRLQALNQKYRVVAQILSMLTIVMLITLVQAAFSTYLVASSPVIDFGIQVGVAFLVLPVENFLRKVMFSTNENNRLYQFINPSLKKPTNVKQ